jgi:phosphoribosylanthranilate isomerase
MSVAVKICGLNSPEAVRAAAEADYAGFVFYAPSPRNVTPEEARRLARTLPAGVTRVALLVDADDAFIEAAVDALHPDLLQLHGKETPQRVAAIKRAFSLPVMKAIPVREAADLTAADPYLDIADRLLFDARPPERAGALPGGNAEAFDWRLLAGRSFALPWMLSGGLTSANVTQAIRISGAAAVDVSSGVEDRPGLKNVCKIKGFIDTVRAC